MLLSMVGEVEGEAAGSAEEEKKVQRSEGHRKRRLDNDIMVSSCFFRWN